MRIGQAREMEAVTLDVEFAVAGARVAHTLRFAPHRSILLDVRPGYVPS